MISLRLKIANLLLFQVGWFACVLGAANGLPWAGVAAVAVLGAWHLMRARARAREAALLIGVGVIGYAFESLQRHFNMLAYPGAAGDLSLAPLWMAALWVNFATTLNLSLSWFKAHPGLAALAALIAGPGAYYAGMALGAIAMPNVLLALISIGLGWAILFPLSLWFAGHMNGFVAAPDQTQWQQEPTHV